MLRREWEVVSEAAILRLVKICCATQHTGFNGDHISSKQITAEKNLEEKGVREA